MKVVMVDDSAADRRLCRILLEETHGSSIQFWEESAALPGLETCRVIVPDCLLLDYILPDMTGLEFLNRLQTSHPSERPPMGIVMLTGMASEQVAVEAMKAGAHDYLVKDRITPEGLSSAIDKATQKVRLMRELQAERDRLAKSLAEKDVLLREVHHRVKNNLQVIASLLRMQAKSVAGEGAARAFRDSQNRVESMALVHEQLYATDDLREVDLAKHAEALANNLFQSYGVDPARIGRRLEIDSLPLAIDRAIPAGLILNELISNALKHAFPDNRCGTIAIFGRRENGLVVLSVQDDGVGLAKTVDLRRSKSLGLEIVNILTRQLKGTFQVEDGGAIPGGVAWTLSFPASLPVGGGEGAS
jgi:two-component sensor histidine kinase/CheY-like chemotaxis protein